MPRRDARDAGLARRLAARASLAAQRRKRRSGAGAVSTGVAREGLTREVGSTVLLDVQQHSRGHLRGRTGPHVGGPNNDVAGGTHLRRSTPIIGGPTRAGGAHLTPRRPPRPAPSGDSAPARVCARPLTARSHVCRSLRNGGRVRRRHLQRVHDGGPPEQPHLRLHQLVAQRRCVPACAFWPLQPAVGPPRLRARQLPLRARAPARSHLLSAALNRGADRAVPGRAGDTAWIVSGFSEPAPARVWVAGAARGR